MGRWDIWELPRLLQGAGSLPVLGSKEVQHFLEGAESLRHSCSHAQGVHIGCMDCHVLLQLRLQLCPDYVHSPCCFAAALHSRCLCSSLVLALRMAAGCHALYLKLPARLMNLGISYMSRQVQLATL